MDLNVRTTTYVQDSDKWLGSAHGTDTAHTITLDMSLFTEATHFPNGFIPSGMTLGKVTASGKYGPYNNALANGQETMVGFLYKPVKVHSDNTAGNAIGALLQHGFIDESELPTNHGLDANGKADVPGQFIYV